MSIKAAILYLFRLDIHLAEFMRVTGGGKFIVFALRATDSLVKIA